MGDPVAVTCDNPSRNKYKRKNGCRCPGCKAANAAGSRGWRAQTGQTTRENSRNLPVDELYNCTVTLEEWHRRTGR